MIKISKDSRQQGQLLILAIVVMGLLIINTLILLSGSLLFKENSSYSAEALEATSLAEAGVDKAVASLNATAGGYAGESETQLAGGSFQVTVVSKNATNKIIESTGYTPSKSNPKSRRTIRIEVAKGIGAAFNYGVQTGNGGLNMSNNSQVNGSVYSNGNIFMSNNAKITGDAYVAGGVQPTADQQSDCSVPNCVDFIFGKNVNGQNQLDIAQSFTPSTSNILNEVSLKLKKFGTPSDLTVRILGDSSGSPDKSTVLASGTLTANLVTSQYGFTTIVFPSPPSLQEHQTYWIMLDTSSDSSNYWAWSEDSSQGYNGGKAMFSSNWQANPPVWNNITGDLGFQTYMGGVATYISGSNGATIGGNAHANTIQNLSITNGAYYQVSQNISAGSLHPNSPDPITQPMPISENNIQEWKNTAQAAGVHNGNITNCPSSMPAGYYNGSINLPSGCTIVVGTPIWASGTLNLTNSDTLKLDPSYGASSGVFIVDGVTNISNNNKLVGSGTGGSYLILLSTFDSQDDEDHRVAVNISNNGNSGIVYSNLGNINISNNNNLTEITAWKLTLANNVVINYDQGLASAFFSSGPGGSFTAVKGTYQVK